jgi:hypothetical protein
MKQLCVHQFYSIYTKEIHVSTEELWAMLTLWTTYLETVK